MGFARWFGVFVAVLTAILAALIQRYSTKVYPVPPKGGVVLSGASTGIGYHAAITLADEGYTVYAGVRKDADAERLKSLGKPTLVPVILDVAEQESVEMAYEEVKADAASKGIPIMGVVNNAGIMQVAPVEFAPVPDMQYIFNVNLWGAIRLTQRFLPEIRASQGRVIMVSSVAGFFTVPRAAAYSATKHAMESFSDGLRMELAKHNVSVTVIQPGAVRSAIFGKATDSEHRINSEDPRVKEVYGHLIKNRRDDFLDKADGPEVTSEAILHALSSPTPKTRYVVANIDGVPCSVVKAILWLMPDRIRDALVLAQFT